MIVLPKNSSQLSAISCQPKQYIQKVDVLQIERAMRPSGPFLKAALYRKRLKLTVEG
jgi:hypothetical protein